MKVPRGPRASRASPQHAEIEKTKSTEKRNTVNVEALAQRLVGEETPGPRRAAPASQTVHPKRPVCKHKDLVKAVAPIAQEQRLGLVGARLLAPVLLEFRPDLGARRAARWHARRVKATAGAASNGGRDDEGSG